MKPCRTLDRIVRDRAGAQGDLPAYTFLRDGEIEDRTITFAELDREGRAVAAMLQGWRITRPLLVYAPGLDFITSFFGCLYAGITPIPAGLPHVARVGRALTRLSAIARDAGADAILSTTHVIDRAFADPDFSMRAPELAAMRWLATESVDLAQRDNWTPPAVEPSRPALFNTHPDPRLLPRVSWSRMAMCCTTFPSCRSNGGNTERSISISWLPHSHDMGLIEAILLPAFVGYRAYLMAPAAFLARPARWLEAITRYGGTNSGGPDFAYALCVDKVSADEQQRLELSSWRVAYNGSESVRKNTLVRFRDRFEPWGFQWNAFRPVYGLAESTLLVSTFACLGTACVSMMRTQMRWRKASSNRPHAGEPLRQLCELWPQSRGVLFSCRESRKPCSVRARSSRRNLDLRSECRRGILAPSGRDCSDV